jgi:putative DNA primase/helicase
VDSRLAAGLSYLERGWQIFVLGVDKKPIGNCPDCPSHNAIDASGQRHDAESCPHLFCHGFYAATGDPDRLKTMLERQPEGMLAARLGRVSGIVVFDAEGEPDAPGQPTGVDSLENFEAYAGGVELPLTLTARTPSGGMHCLYALGPDDPVFKAKPRILPAVDFKAESGYIALPPAAGRTWVDANVPITPLTPGLITWILAAKGHAKGVVPGGDADIPDGYDYEAYLKDGAPAGVRDVFVNEVVYRLRKSGVPKPFAEQSLKAQWDKMAQPQGNEFSWDKAMEKLDRVWLTVDPDEVVIPDLFSLSYDGHDIETMTSVLMVRDVELPSELVTGPANPHRSTDRANGIAVWQALRGQALWVPEAKADWAWYVWDGRRWRPDKERIIQQITGKFTDEQRRIATSGTMIAADAEALMKRAARLESSAGLNGALRFAAPYLARSITLFDRDPWLFNCVNGVLDLRTGDLRAATPDLLITRICSTAYEPDARDGTWEQVVWEALSGEHAEHRMRALGRFAGYMLTGSTREKTFLVLKGPRDTGKSTISEALYYTLGDVADGGYATTWEADTVISGVPVNRTEKLAKSRAARMVLVGELTKGSRLSDGFIKGYVGGDTLDARGLYENSFSYRPQAKLVFATNYMPHSDDPAVHGRILWVPFEHVPDRLNREYKRHLDEDADAHAAVLAWAVRGCLAWQHDHSLGSTPWMDAFIRAYVLESDHVLDYVDQRLIKHGGGWEDSVGVSALWNDYQFWAASNVHRPLRRRQLDRALAERGMLKARHSSDRGEWRWLGWGLVRDE